MKFQKIFIKQTTIGIIELWNMYMYKIYITALPNSNISKNIIKFAIQYLKTEKKI